MSEDVVFFLTFSIKCITVHHHAWDITLGDSYKSALLAEITTWRTVGTSSSGKLDGWRAGKWTKKDCKTNREPKYIKIKKCVKILNRYAFVSETIYSQSKKMKKDG